MRIALEEAGRARAEGVTAHAETVVLRRLSTRLRVLNPGFRADTGPLAGAVLYTTVEPCPMCAFAACAAGVSRVVIGARYAQMGVRYGDYAIEKLLALADQRLEIVSGILADECAALRLGR